MFENFRNSLQSLYNTEIVGYWENLTENPFKLITSILDIVIVVFLIYVAAKYLRKTRAWQLLRGIAVLVICTIVSRMAKLNYITLHINITYDVWWICPSYYISA